MAGALTIFDVSPFIYTGENITYKYSRKKQFPIKGLNYFLKYLAATLATYDDVLICFDSKSFRKSIDSKYKSNRTPNPDVYAQLELLYTFLPKFGFCCLKQDGAEADDLIFTCVEKYKDKYSRINIYSADYDIAHNVSDNVNLLAVNSNTMDIKVESFQSILKVPYNTITAYKLFNGDKSDNIPSLGSVASSLFEIYLFVIQKMNYNQDYSKTREFMEDLLNHIYPNYLDDSDIEIIRKRLDLVYPKMIDVGYNFQPSNINTIDLSGFTSFLNSLDNTVALKSLRSEQQSYNKELESYLKIVGESLNKGFYSIDNNLVANCEKMDIDSFIVKDF